MNDAARITFYTDENTPDTLIEQLRERDIEVVRFLDVHRRGEDDAVHLEHATQHRYVIVTRDADFFRLQRERWRQELEAAGVVYINHDIWADIGTQLERLIEIHGSETSDTMFNRQEWI